VDRRPLVVRTKRGEAASLVQVGAARPTRLTVSLAREHIAQAIREPRAPAASGEDVFGTSSPSHYLQVSLRSAGVLGFVSSGASPAPRS
jgi:hypothetical protein